jgi:hypothetical protein
MINQVGTQTIEENIAKAVAQEKESELALGEVRVEPWADINIYHWDRQTHKA